jgi:hypothetical protein
MTEGNCAGGPNARLGRTVDWAGKKLTESMRWARKIGEGILMGQNRNEKKRNKTGKDFWTAKNSNFDSIDFLFKNSLKHMQVRSYFVRLIA